MQFFLPLQKCTNALEQVKSRGGNPILICNEITEDLKGKDIKYITVPQAVDCLQGSPKALSCQLRCQKLRQATRHLHWQRTLTLILKGKYKYCRPPCPFSLGLGRFEIGKKVNCSDAADFYPVRTRRSAVMILPPSEFRWVFPGIVLMLVASCIVVLTVCL